MKFDLIRFQSDSYGTFGALMTNGFACFTVEKPWMDNAPYTSCIPVGEYICDRYHSVKFGGTFRVKDVPSRTSILFHKGNTPKDVSGCIALGKTHGKTGSRWGVWESSTAFAEFMDSLGDEKEFLLTITEVSDNVAAHRRPAL